MQARRQYRKFSDRRIDDLRRVKLAFPGPPLGAVHGVLDQFPAEPPRGGREPGIGQHHVGLRHLPAGIVHDREHTAAATQAAQHATRIASLSQFTRHRCGCVTLGEVDG